VEQSHLEALNTTRRTVRYTVGWKMTDAEEAAIAVLAADDWQVSLHQDATLQAEYGIAELTGLNTRTGWPQGLRLLVRRTRPSRTGDAGGVAGAAARAQK
jgi:hypothetical protein